MPADHDDGDGRVFPANDLEKLKTVELAALQPHIQNHERRAALPNGIDRFRAVVGAAGGVPLVLQNTCDQCADIALVVDDQNVVGHGSSSCPLRSLRIIVRPSRVVEPTRFPSRLAGIPD